MRIKVRIITFLLLLITFAANAQDKRKDLFRLGLRGGYNLASLKLKGDNLPTSKSLSAYNFGAVIETGIVPLINLQGGLLYSRKGGELSNSSGNVKYNIDYLEIPVVVRLKPRMNEKLKVYFGVGGYYASGIGGTYKSSIGGVNEDGDISFGKGSSDDIQKSDLGFVFQAGIEMGKRINFEFTYDLGTSDISAKNSSFEMYNKTVSFNMVFYFWTIKGREQVSKSTKKRILNEGK